MNKSDGGSAFPRAEGENCSEVDGMSLLDYFAAAALPEMHRVKALQAQEIFAQIGDKLSEQDCLEFVRSYFKGAAEASYELAEAMLAERERRRSQ